MFDLFAQPDEPDGDELLASGPRRTREADLTAQSRNARVLLPLLRLEQNKTQIFGQAGLPTAKLDVLHHCYHLFDHLTDALQLKMGLTRARMHDLVRSHVGKTNPELTQAQRETFSRLLLDNLMNQSAANSKFSFGYFDALQGSWRSRDFWLLQSEQSYRGEITYQLTNEGLVNYFTALNLDSDIALQVEAFMVQKLITRGRLDQAESRAHVLRQRCIAFQSGIDHALERVRRSPEAFDYEQELRPQLEQAKIEAVDMSEQLTHLSDLVQKQLSSGFTRQDQHAQLVRIDELINASSHAVRLLHHSLMEANEIFRDLQLKAFIQPDLMAGLELEQDLLRPLLGLDLDTLAERAEGLLANLLPPVARKQFDPIRLMEKLDRELDVSDLGLAAEPEPEYETLARHSRWSEQQLAGCQTLLSTRLQQVGYLELGELWHDTALDADERDGCLHLLWALALDSQGQVSWLPPYHCSLGEPFDFDGLRGHNLRLELLSHQADNTATEASDNTNNRASS